MADLDFFIGDEALDHDQALTITLPIPLSMAKWIIGMLWNDIGLYIVMNCFITLAVGYTTSKDKGGMDAGNGAMHILPVANSYVIRSSIKSIPIAGKDVTLLI
ncbi:hypothetical protein Gotur_012933 [Gossypium turneri]